VPPCFILLPPTALHGLPDLYLPDLYLPDLYLSSLLLATFFYFILYRPYPRRHPPTHTTHATHLHQPTQLTIYIYIYIYTCIYICIHTYTHTHTHTHTHLFLERRYRRVPWLRRSGGNDSGNRRAAAAV
jgi:hypothetical protein